MYKEYNIITRNVFKACVPHAMKCILIWNEKLHRWHRLGERDMNGFTTAGNRRTADVTIDESAYYRSSRRRRDEM